jgi:hypothetical protein
MGCVHITLRFLNVQRKVVAIDPHMVPIGGPAGGASPDEGSTAGAGTGTSGGASAGSSATGTPSLARQSHHGLPHAR